MRRHLAAFGAALVAMSATVATVAPAPASPATRPGDEVTVIAVIDDGITPYHWDYLASKMPASPDVPLDRPPHEWLRGFPSPQTFGAYESLDLTLEEKNPTQNIEALHAQD